MNTVKWTILLLATALTTASCQDADPVQNSLWVNNNIPPLNSFYQPTYWTPAGLFWYYYYPTPPFYNQYPPRPVYWNPVQQNEGVGYPLPGGLQTSPTYQPPNAGTTQSVEFPIEGEITQEQTTTEANLNPSQSELDWSFLEDDEFDWLNAIDFGEEDWTGFDVKSVFLNKPRNIVDVVSGFEERSPTGVITGFVATQPNTAIARSTSITTGQRNAVSSASAFAG